MTKEGVLIVGAGHAAAEAASALRKATATLPITIVGDETSLPYQRPPLSKQFLTGEMESEALELRPHGFYRQNDIEVKTGTTVTEIQLGQAGGGIAVTASGDELQFKDLIFATGAAARRLEVAGAGIAGVLYLRDIADASVLRLALQNADHVVIVGGGFIGLETASVAASAGKTTHVVQAGARLLGGRVAPVVSDFYRDAHTRRGVKFHFGSCVSRIEGSGGEIKSVLLMDGTRLKADIVLVGIGADPRTELARGAGIHCQNGIVVDDRARTDHRGVYAIGDCTAQPLQGRPEASLIRLESVQNAIDQARAAAGTILGAEPEQPTIPRFWSNQGDLRLQTVGISHGWDQLIVRGDVGDEKFSVLYFRDRELIAADAINLSADFTASRLALVRGVSIRPEDAETVPELRSLIKK